MPRCFFLIAEPPAARQEFIGGATGPAGGKCLTVKK
jgi:hypothetical protein